MPKAPVAITSPKIKKLAEKALKSPSMMSTAETRELGSAVMAHLSPAAEVSVAPAKKASPKKAAVKKTSPTKAAAKKTPPKKAAAKKTPAKSS